MASIMKQMKDPFYVNPELAEVHSAAVSLHCLD